VFINTLPLRIDVDAGVLDAVRATHARLTALLGHEHASLALAQRCSGVARRRRCSARCSTTGTVTKPNCWSRRGKPGKASNPGQRRAHQLSADHERG
jgi:hypothetical protein